MYKKMILVNIVLWIVLLFAFVCVAEILASPIQDEQAKATEDTSETEMVEGAQSASPDVVLEERRETESENSAPVEEKRRERRRIIAVGDLPEDHDPSLVLRKGRTIDVFLNGVIDSGTSLEGICTFDIYGIVYDDSDQIILIPPYTRIRCLYEISGEQDRIRMYFTVIDMGLEPVGYNASVRFSDPPRATYVGSFNITSLSSADKKRIEKEYLQLRKQLFSSPVISAELILRVESEDRKPKYGKIIFNENASGDRTVSIGSAYKMILQVEKDILFSRAFIPRGSHMIRSIERSRIKRH